MIIYSLDGNTLIGVDDKGKEFSHNKTEGNWFSDMLVILGAQQQAVLDNAATLLGYNQALAQVQGPLDVGQGPANPVAPPKPQCKFVSDIGNVTFGPFVPALADLIIPTTSPSHVNTGTVGLTTYDMVLRMYQKEFPQG